MVHSLAYLIVIFILLTKLIQISYLPLIFKVLIKTKIMLIIKKNLNKDSQEVYFLELRNIRFGHLPSINDTIYYLNN